MTDTDQKKSRFAKVADNLTRLRSEPEQSPAPPPGPAPAKTGRPGGKKNNPDYDQVTVYLRKTVYTEARKLLFDERRQFSDLVDELVSQWVQTSRSRAI